MSGPGGGRPRQVGQSGDVSGVLDTSVALAGPVVTVPPEATSAATSLACSIDGTVLQLPLAPEALRVILHRAYLVGGFKMLRQVHDAALLELRRQREGNAMAILWLDAALAEADRRIGEARQRIGDTGDQSENRQRLSEAQFARMEIEATSAVERQNRLTTLARLDEFRDGFGAAVEDLADAEEEVQRWYEAKLLAVMAADFKRQRIELEKAWRRYRVTMRDSEVVLAFEDAKDAEALRLRGGSEIATVAVQARPKPGTTPRIQGNGTEEEQQPEVLVAVYELAQAEFAYKSALRVRKGMITRPDEDARRVDVREVPAWPKLKAYREAIRKWAQKHPVALAAHRGLFSVSADIAFDRGKLEQAVIGAMIAARDEMPEILRKVTANRLYDGVETVAAPSDGLMTRQAADILVQEKFVVRAHGPGSAPPKPGAGAAQPVVPAGPGQKPADKDIPADIDLYFCPWLQKPFHDRLMTLGALFRHEAGPAQPPQARTGTGEAPVPDGAAPADDMADDGEDGDEAADAKALSDAEAIRLWPDPTDPSLFQEVEHLRGLFADPEDRMRLDWITGTANLSSRARQEAILLVETLVAEQKEMRDKIRLAVTVAGFGLLPFTGGKSLLLAAVIDAALVAEETSIQIQTWLAARQLSAAAVDQMTAAHWTQPEVAQMVATVLEAGYEIAADLLTSGALSRIMDAMGVALLVGSAVAESAQQPGRSVR